MRFKDLVCLKTGKALLLGNEAIARGALEAGIGVAAAYPGTPSSEIVESLMQVRDLLGIYVEWSVNEKVAFEVAYAAAISGVRSLVAMKHVGLNVASDPLMSSAYTGVKEGFVIVSADDPSMWSSQNEQDNRFYGLHAYIPVFEPSSPAEAKELTKYSYGFSSQFKHPVILRITTRISHTRAVVDLGEVGKPKTKGVFIKEPRYVLIPTNARRNKLELVEKINRMVKELSKSPFNKVEGSGGLAVIASGIAYLYVKEALEKLKLGSEVTLIKLSTVYPIPKYLLIDALKDVKKVLVVEEVDPFVEILVRGLVSEEGLNVEIYGKNYLGYPFELTVERVYKALSRFLNIDTALRSEEGSKRDLRAELPQRPPTLCPGCPYRPLFYAVKMFAIRNKLNLVAAGDIGCYSLGYNPPFNLQDIIIEMGGGLGVANGLAKVVENTIITFIGDSTFFHAGIPPLINAFVNRSPQIVVILDNEVTAMTGHQPSPSSRFKDRAYVPIENVVKGIGIRFVKVVDPFNIRRVMNVLSSALEHVRKYKEPAVIVARRRCALEVMRDLGRLSLTAPSYIIDPHKCIACGLCYNWFSCPAIVPGSEGKALIDPELCVGCGACVNVCPVDAIKPSKPYDKESIEKYWF